MSNVHFVDTSVLCSFLNIPGRNDHHDEIIEEYGRLKEGNNTFVIPISTFIETGNHISHIQNGNSRTVISQMLITLATPSNNNHWEVYPRITTDILYAVLSEFQTNTRQKIGIGDTMIIQQFNDFWESKQPIGTLRIWSLDNHLQGYCREGGLKRRKDK